MVKYLSIKKWISRAGLLRPAIQLYLVLLLFFNFTLHLLPFLFWKRLICNIFNIKVAKGAAICSGVRFLALGNCAIGERTIINQDCLLDNRSGLYIGSDVSIASGVKIFTQSHDINDECFSISRGSVKIDNYVCIYSSALIMPNVQLGKGSVVNAGSVVIRSVGELEVVGGNPAKFLKMRKLMPSYRLKKHFWFC
jgi:acetyltransferase-like isoleucine patch superfamily enzyme